GGVSEQDPVVMGLAERGFEVIAPVCPGFARLEDLDDIRDVHDLALWYDDLLESLGLNAVTVVAHSFGGMIAAELASHVPYRVGRLVLASPIGLWRDDEPMADMFPAFPLEIQDLLWADPTKAVLPPPPARQQIEGVDDPLLAMFLQMTTGMTAVGKFIWPLPDKGLRRRLHRISAPTLIIWGAKDKLIPASYADDFAAAIPNARTEILDDAGHMVILERLDDFVAMVTRFVG
ncbi:MAG: alpha/beta hydrolase, partial [Actinobacteria bacterium]|nr:alpha/beta hydrolase [Actinomycetota bacterium]